MILPTHSNFRWRASTRITGAYNATFTDANPDTITDGAANFVADGFLAGMSVEPTGTAANNSRYTIATVAATTLTLTAASTVTNEPAVACTLTAVFRDADGFERFPIALMRPAGFTAGFTGIPTLWTSGPFNVSVNALAADVVAGVDEYHWYLSQRTDPPGVQPMTITPYQGALWPGSTYSGSVTITPTPVTGWTIYDYFKHSDLYCIRISDGGMQWVSILGAMINAAPSF